MSTISQAACKRSGMPARTIWPYISIFLICSADMLVGRTAVLFWSTYLLMLALGAHWLAKPRPFLGVWRATVHFLLIFLLAAVAVLTNSFTGNALPAARDLARDTLYFANGLILFAAGYVLCRNAHEARYTYWALALVGSAQSISKLSHFISNPDLLTLTAADIRAETGLDAGISGFVSVVLLFSLTRFRSLKVFPTYIAWPLLALNSIAFILGFSRTGILTFALLTAAALGLFERRALRRSAALLMFMITSVLAVQFYVSWSGNESKHTLLGKIARAHEEIFPADFISRSQVDSNWRGFESYRAWDTYKNGRADQFLIGQGLGAKVDLGIFQNLGGGEGERLRLIPVLHNGYLFLLVKSGVLGLIIYAAWLYREFQFGRNSAMKAAEKNPSALLVARLYQGLFLSIIANTFITSGPFKKEATILFAVCGVFLALLERSGAAEHIDAVEPAIA